MDVLGVIIVSVGNPELEKEAFQKFPELVWYYDDTSCPSRSSIGNLANNKRA